jgi:drug/metabolite transporter (DMT)-like permease
MSQPKPDLQGLAAALCATASWGMSGIFIRWLSGWSPFLILVGRFWVAIVVMLPFILLIPGMRVSLIHSFSRPIVWGLSLPAIGSYVFGVSSIQMAPVGEVTLLFTTSPLFVMAYKIVKRLPIKRGEWLGTGLAIVGISFVLLPKLSIPAPTSGQTLIGYCFALGAAGLVALYAGWFNQLVKQKLAPPPLDIVFVTFVLGSVLSIFCAVCFSQFSIGEGINRPALLTLLGLGILSTAVPFFCYTVAAQRLPIMLSSAILLLEPVFAILFASVALQEIPSQWFWIGSLFVGGGLLSIASASNLAQNH